MPRFPEGYFSKAKLIEVTAIRKVLKRRGVETGELSDEDIWKLIENAQTALREVTEKVLKLNEAVKSLDPMLEYYLRQE